ncbi:MAG: glycosyltransferase family A protein [Patescibacteria group bacterium]|jgi:glycosyltransferase involved in cell wall biosynthesis
MISVIIPLYNQAKNLPSCLESILIQTIPELEVIIVDDGSSDQSRAVAESYKKKFGEKDISFRLLNHDMNKGAPAARNTGFRSSKGEYLFFCDADVVLSQEALSSMLNALNSNPKASFAYSSFWWGRKLFKLFPFDREKLEEFPYINMMSLMRRECFPGFDESLKKFQDWDLWLTITKGGKIGVWIGRPLYRVRPGGTMSDWLPGFAYRLFPFLPAVKKYKKAMIIIKNKHGLA